MKHTLKRALALFLALLLAVPAFAFAEPLDNDLQIAFDEEVDAEAADSSVAEVTLDLSQMTEAEPAAPPADEAGEDAVVELEEEEIPEEPAADEAAQAEAPAIIEEEIPEDVASDDAALLTSIPVTLLYKKNGTQFGPTMRPLVGKTINLPKQNSNYTFEDVTEPNPEEYFNRDHLTLYGWCDAATDELIVDQYGDPAFEFTVPSGEEGVTLYALWTADVSFNDQGAETYVIPWVTVFEDDVVASELDDDELEEQENPEKTGYTFVKWAGSLNPDADEFDLEATPVTEDIDLYAIWSINHYSVQFVDWDGSVIGYTPDPAIVDDNGDIAYGTLIYDFKPNDPTSYTDTAGYTHNFEKWVDEDGKELDATTTVTCDVVYTAVYTNDQETEEITWNVRTCVGDPDYTENADKADYAVGTMPVFADGAEDGAYTAHVGADGNPIPYDRKEGNEYHKYTFQEWEPAVESVTSTSVKEYNAVYASADGTESYDLDVARIGDNFYTTLDDALAAADDLIAHGARAVMIEILADASIANESGYTASGRIALVSDDTLLSPGEYFAITTANKLTVPAGTALALVGNLVLESDVDVTGDKGEVDVVYGAEVDGTVTLIAQDSVLDIDAQSKVDLAVVNHTAEETEIVEDATNKTFVCGSAVAKIDYEDENDLYFDTLSAATASQSLVDGDVIVLFKPVTLNSNVVVNKNVAIDLGGNEVTTTDAYGFTFQANQITGEEAVLGNGTVKGPKGITVTSGYVVIDATVATTTSAALTVNGGEVYAAGEMSATSADGATVSGGQLWVLNTVKTTDLSNAAPNAKSGVVVTGGELIVAADEDAGLSADISSIKGAGIYQTGGRVGIVEGAVTGASAVYVKAGTLTVRGNELIANGAKVNYQYKDNGYYPTGDAIVVDNGGNGGATVQIFAEDVDFTTGGAEVAAYPEDQIQDSIYTDDSDVSVLDTEIWLEMDAPISTQYGQLTHRLKKAHVVTFDLLDGKAVDADDASKDTTEKVQTPVKVADGTTVADPAATNYLTKDGYLFIGWEYESSTGVWSDFDFSTQIMQDYYIRAKWSNLLWDVTNVWPEQETEGDRTYNVNRVDSDNVDTTTVVLSDMKLIYDTAYQSYKLKLRVVAPEGITEENYKNWKYSVESLHIYNKTLDVDTDPDQGFYPDDDPAYAGRFYMDVTTPLAVDYIEDWWDAQIDDQGNFTPAAGNYQYDHYEFTDGTHIYNVFVEVDPRNIVMIKDELPELQIVDNRKYMAVQFVNDDGETEIVAGRVPYGKTLGEAFYTTATIIDEEETLPEDPAPVLEAHEGWGFEGWQDPVYPDTYTYEELPTVAITAPGTFIAKYQLAEAEVYVGNNAPVRYAFVDDAFDAANRAEEEPVSLKLLNNAVCVGSVEIERDMEIVLDGHTLTLNDYLTVDANGADLVIDGAPVTRGELIVPSRIEGTINVYGNGATLVLNDGEYVGADGSAAIQVYTDGGTVTINGTENTSISADQSCEYAIDVSDGELILKNVDQLTGKIWVKVHNGTEPVLTLDTANTLANGQIVYDSGVVTANYKPERADEIEILTPAADLVDPAGYYWQSDDNDNWTLTYIKAYTVEQPGSAGEYTTYYGTVKEAAEVALAAWAEGEPLALYLRKLDDANNYIEVRGGNVDAISLEPMNNHTDETWLEYVVDEAVGDDDYNIVTVNVYPVAETSVTPGLTNVHRVVLKAVATKDDYPAYDAGCDKNTGIEVFDGMDPTTVDQKFDGAVVEGATFENVWLPGVNDQEYVVVELNDTMDDFVAIYPEEGTYTAADNMIAVENAFTKLGYFMAIEDEIAATVYNEEDDTLMIFGSIDEAIVYANEVSKDVDWNAEELSPVTLRIWGTTEEKLTFAADGDAHNITGVFNIDLNGKTIKWDGSGAANSAVIIGSTSAAGGLIITDGSQDGTGSIVFAKDCSCGFVVRKNSHFVLYAGTLTPDMSTGAAVGTLYGVAISPETSNGEVIVNGGTIVGKYTGIYDNKGENASITVNGGDIIGNTKYGIHVMEGTSLTITGGRFAGDRGSLKVEGTPDEKITISGTEDGAPLFTHPLMDAWCDMSSGEYAERWYPTMLSEPVEDEDNGFTYAYTVLQDPTCYVESGTDGINRYYATVADAIETEDIDINTDDSLEIFLFRAAGDTREIAENVEIPAGREITLQLNGQTLTNVTEMTGAKATILVDGEVEAEGPNPAIDAAILVIAGEGTVKSNGSVDAIVNDGVLMIGGPDINIEVAGVEKNAITNNSILEIDNANVTGGKYVIYNGKEAILAVPEYNQGIFTANGSSTNPAENSVAIIKNLNEAEIDAGRFVAKNAFTKGIVNAYEPVYDEDGVTVTAGKGELILSNDVDMAGVNSGLHVDHEEGEELLGEVHNLATQIDPTAIRNLPAGYSWIYNRANDWFEVRVMVASINGTLFASVADALAAVQNGETIVLEKDEIHEVVVIDGNVTADTFTIDVNGKILDNKGTKKDTLTIAQRKTIVIEDNSENPGAINSVVNGKRALYVQGKVTIDDGVIIARPLDNGTAWTGGTEVTEEDPDHPGQPAPINTFTTIGVEADGTLNILNAVVINNGVRAYAINNAGTLTIEDGEFEGGHAVIHNENTVVINGGSFKGIFRAPWNGIASGADPFRYYTRAILGNANAAASATINSAEFAGESGEYDEGNYYTKGIVNYDGTVYIGGEITSGEGIGEELYYAANNTEALIVEPIPSRFLGDITHINVGDEYPTAVRLPKGYSWKLDGRDNKWHVVAGSIAWNNTTKLSYASLQDAISYAADGDELWLLQDVTEHVVFVNRGEYTLDLRGNDITSDEDDPAITVAEGVILTLTDTVGLEDQNEKSRITGRIYNTGVVFIETMSMATANTEANLILNEGTMLIQGGDYFGGLYTLGNTGTLAITGGVFDNPNEAVLWNEGYTAVFGGGLKAAKDVIVNINDAKLNINVGDDDGVKPVLTPGTGVVVAVLLDEGEELGEDVISETNEPTVTEGYAWRYDFDEEYYILDEVVAERYQGDDPAVFKGSYASLLDALTEAEYGDDIVMVADSTEKSYEALDNKIEINTYVRKLDLAGYTVKFEAPIEVNEYVNLLDSVGDGAMIYSGEGTMVTVNGDMTLSVAAQTSPAVPKPFLTGFTVATIENPNGTAIYVAEDGYLNIEGGKVTGKDCAVSVDPDANYLDLSGGVFTAETPIDADAVNVYIHRFPQEWFISWFEAQYANADTDEAYALWMQPHFSNPIENDLISGGVCSVDTETIPEGDYYYIADELSIAMNGGSIVDPITESVVQGVFYGDNGNALTIYLDEFAKGDTLPLEEDGLTLTAEALAQAWPDQAYTELRLYGYELDGWKNLTTGEMYAGEALEEDVVFEAQWKPGIFNLKYVDSDDETVVYGEYDVAYRTTDIPVPEEIPTKPGKTFSKWNTIPAMMPGEDVVVKAEWTLNDSTIIFNWGHGLEPDVVEGTYGDPYDMPEAPIVEGYEFLNGFVDKDGNPVDAPDTIPAESIELFAVYGAIEYTITYDLDGGDVLEVNPETYTIEDEDITLVNPVKEGYEFRGWTGTDLEQAELVVTIPTGSTGDRAYTATWKAIEYTIEYDLAGGDDLENPTTYTVESEDITLINPIKKGCDFTGWTEEINGEITGEGLMEVVIPTGSIGDRKYTATWDAIEYQITYVLDEGAENDPDNPETYTAEDEFKFKPAIFEGHDFTGWFEDVEGGKKIDGIELGTTGDLTIKTVFDKRLGNLVFYTYDESGEAVEYYSENDVPYGDLIKDHMPEEDPTREGYEFLGWVDADGNPLTDDAKVEVETMGETLQFFSTWEGETHVIVFSDGFDLVIKSVIAKTGDKVVITDLAAEALATIDMDDYEGLMLVEGKEWTTELPEGEITIAEDLIYQLNWFKIVATVDGNPYPSIEEAVAAAEDADDPTITLQDDVEYQMEKDGVILVDSNGYDLDIEAAEGQVLDVVEVSEGVAVYASLNLVTFYTDPDTVYTDELVASGDTVEEPEAPTKEGYEFLYWCGEDGEEFDFATPITSSIDLTAAWKIQTFTVTFMDGEEEWDSQEVNYGEKPVVPDTPTKEGEDFLGWLDEEGNEFDPEAPVTADCIYYADWATKVLEVSFYDAGSTKPIVVLDVPYGTKMNPDDIPTVTPPEGEEFNGWYLDDQGEEPFPLDSDIFEDTVLVAQYVTLTFDVVFESDHGVVPEAQVVEYGQKAVEPEPLTAENFVFKGWFEDGAAEPFDFDTEITDDVTLIAAWAPAVASVDGVNYDSFEEAADVAIATGKTLDLLADPELEEPYEMAEGDVLTIKNDSDAVIDPADLLTTPDDSKYEIKATENEDESVTYECVEKTILTVYFETEYGTAPDPQVLESGSKAENPGPVEVENLGYAFVAWQLDGEDYDFATPVTSDITLTAKWERLPEFISEHSMTLSSDISLNFFLDMHGMEDKYADSYVIFQVEGEEAGEPIPFSEAVKDGNEYKFKCAVKSVQMATPITATLYDKDGKAVSTITDSILNFYQTRVIPAIDEGRIVGNSAALYKAVANYGYFAQQYLSEQNGWVIGEKYAEMPLLFPDDANYDKDAIIADLESKDQEIVKELAGSDINAAYMSLNLLSQTTLYVDLEPVSGYTALPTCTLDGNPVTATKQGTDNRVTVEAISAKKLFNKYVIVATTPSGAATVKASAMSYAYAILKKSTKEKAVLAMEALYTYAAAVEAYNP